MDQNNLSQQMTQLSTTTTTNRQQYCIEEITIAVNRLPDYLTRRNKLFQLMLRTVLSTRTVDANHRDMEDLRQIAIAVYKIMFIQTHQLLWTTYRMAGMGQIPISSGEPSIYSTNIPSWPKQVREAVTSAGAAETHVNEHSLAYVNHYLNEWNKHLELNRTDLNIKANKFTAYTLLLQRTIEAYIERNLSVVRAKIEHQVELVVYEYHIQALKVEFNCQKPSAVQVCVL